MAILTEDDLYRTSTQYRLWSFTQEALSSLRSTTNESAAEGVRAALYAQNAAEQSSKQDSHVSPAQEVECLSVDEEQKLVGFYCVQTMKFADFCDFPTNVKATAVQYLKRFYLTNSPMTYHPKEMMPSALFLATKTENHYTSLKSFVSKLPKTTAEDVVAPEFLLTQGLRFTFDVRHPHRGLEGGFMELLALATGKELSNPSTGASAAQNQQQMFNLDPATERGKKMKSRTAEEVVRRIQHAHSRAKEMLKTSALLTDAYLLFSPSQIWLSSLFVADEPLARFYIDIKFPTPSDVKPKLLSVLQTCANLLLSSASADPEDSEVQELKKIDKKLYKCRNPEKIDLVGINKAHKREGHEDGLDEKVIKKRKLERQQSEKEAEDIFGPALGVKDGK